VQRAIDGLIYAASMVLPGSARRRVRRRRQQGGCPRAGPRRPGSERPRRGLHWHPPHGPLL